IFDLSLSSDGLLHFIPLSPSPHHLLAGKCVYQSPCISLHRRSSLLPQTELGVQRWQSVRSEERQRHWPMRGSMQTIRLCSSQSIPIERILLRLRDSPVREWSGSCSGICMLHWPIINFPLQLVFDLCSTSTVFCTYSILPLH
ncbi:hypothetical protein PMAYCL1PPCAC_17944, partial [Pristionchus mayeri]